MYTFRASRVPDPLRVSRRVGWGFHPDEVVVDTLLLRKVAHHTRARRAEHGQVWGLEASKETQNLCSIIVNDGPTIPRTPFPPCHFPVLGHPAKEMREYPPPTAATTRPLPPRIVRAFAEFAVCARVAQASLDRSSCEDVPRV